MNATRDAAGTAAAQVARDAAIHQAIEGALRELEEHAGEEGYRHLFDKALHVLVAIDRAGFRVVRKRSKP
jgi:uncharacterized protein with PhoU and TrkA domain